MLSSRQHVASKRASPSQKKLLEDEKPTKEKKKILTKEETKNKTSGLPIKQSTSSHLKKSSSSLSTTPRTGPLKATTKPTANSKQTPLTPPSKRVTKTQFFPNRPTYSNTIPKKSTSNSPSTGSSTTSTPRTKSTESRPSVKEFIKKAREEKKKKSEPVETKRPGTATLTNPVVLKNIEEQASEDYEDDFDSYESDFEAYSSESSSDVTDVATSTDDTDESEIAAVQEKRISSAATDEEKKLDSGTFDLPEQKYKQVLHNITETVEKENHNKNPASLPDEGFEDVKSLTTDNECFINFSGAQKKLKQSKRRKRGEEILRMIKLDSYSFTLFDLPPMSYERYIKLYGQRNCVQASSQTGDDNIDEECQTEEIIKKCKWTQAPVAFSMFDIAQPNYLNVYKKEFLGVGSDDCDNTENGAINYNYHQYNKFIQSAGQLLLNLLQESDSQSLKELQPSTSITFSSGYMECNTETIPLLKTTFVTYITYNSTDCSQFLTVHKQKSCTNGDDSKNILCTWYLSNLNQPERVFVSYSDITCCCFSYTDRNCVFGGSSDGSISVWSSKQFTDSQPQVPRCISEVGLGHVTNVISIHSVFTLSDELDNANQLCSLDEEGNIIFWSVISKTNDVVLAQNNKISMYASAPDVLCTSMFINKLDPNHLFVSTSMGYVVHTLNSGTRTHPKKYRAPMTSCVTCMAACPFSELYFLAGFHNGCVALYSRMVEKPLIVMINKNSESGVDQIEWSCSKPCVFYVRQQDMLDIWDLSVSDMLPAYSVPFKERLEYVKLMPATEKCKKTNKSCMVIGYSGGELQLHILSKEHGQNSVEGFKQDVKKFLNYVNRL